MIHAAAMAIAQRLVGELAPYCDRVEIAGSVRRQVREVGDIEIVAIPREVISVGDLFGGQERDPGFVAAVDRYHAVKGSPHGKYTQRALPDGIALDLFIAKPENWGLIFAIRTGSAEFCKRYLAPAWVKAGFTSSDGMLTRNNQAYCVREEEQLFRMIGLTWIKPENRL